jgi:hypothetical protein
MNYTKLNAFNEYCKSIPEYNKVKPSQVIIIWKSYKWKMYWIGCIIGIILYKMGIRFNENKLHGQAKKP